jgi:hypothetical protein
MSLGSRRPPLSHASVTPVTENLNIRTPGPSVAIFQDPSAGDVQ